MRKPLIALGLTLAPVALMSALQLGLAPVTVAPPIAPVVEVAPTVEPEPQPVLLPVVPPPLDRTAPCPAGTDFRMSALVTTLVKTNAARNGLDPVLLWIVTHIESAGNPSAETGKYNGLLQLSWAEFRARGGTNVFDPTQNMYVGAAKIAEESAEFAEDFKRQPSPTEVYLLHQQGTAGLRAHLAEPDRLAWQSMYSTGEGRSKGVDWSRLAISGNIPSDLRTVYGGVDRITSAQFIDLWSRKIEARRPAAMKALKLCGQPDGIPMPPDKRVGPFEDRPRVRIEIIRPFADRD